MPVQEKRRELDPRSNKILISRAENFLSVKENF